MIVLFSFCVILVIMILRSESAHVDDYFFIFPRYIFISSAPKVKRTITKAVAPPRLIICDQQKHPMPAKCRCTYIPLSSLALLQQNS